MTVPALENGVLAAWSFTLARNAARAAIFGADGSVLRTFNDIEAEARRSEELLTGLAPRQVVAVEIGNSERWPALLLALFRRALIPLPLGGHMQQAELDLALETCRASALVTSGPDGLDVKQFPRTSAETAWTDPAPEFLKLTSGTTNAPRAIRFRAAQLVADCENICVTMGITECDRNYGVIPFSHSYGFSNLLTPLLCRGVALVATEDRMPRAILDGLARSGATVFPGMPVFYAKLADLENAPALPAVRLWISAGAPLPRAVGEKFTAKFGGRIHTFYGSSECGGIGYDTAGDGDYIEGFVGKPMRGVTITGGSDDGAAIEVRSAAVGDGYFPEADDAVLGGGCFVPADLIRQTHGGMHLAGRASDVINIAGRKLNPLEIEARLAESPGGLEAVVFGVKSDTRGEEPIACVASDKLTRDAVLRMCRERLSAWQVPREVWIVPEIPVNERGKISRRALAERYLKERAK